MYLLQMMIACILTAMGIPILVKLCEKIKFMDYPNQRKKHRAAIPMAGGMAIYLVFSSLYLLWVPEYSTKTLGVFFAGTLIFAIGLFDDYIKSQKKDLPALPKLVVQLLAAHILFSVGIAFKGFSIPFMDYYVLLPIWIQYILTLLWIFGVTTVINFSDGLDGLAGGMSCISATTLLIVSLLMKDVLPALVCALLIGALLGYLRFNKPPARVFMGDAGSTFVGFMLAMVSLEGVYKEATLLSLFMPLLIFGVPIFDNIYVILRRMREGSPIYKADRLQVHHRLIDKGFSAKQINGALYLLTFCLCLLAMQLYWIEQVYTR